jgi:class 3 adenylate cyclase
MVLARTRFDSLLANTIERSGGQLARLREHGDAALSFFHTMSSAVRAAVQLRAALGNERWPVSDTLRVRIALHTGETQLHEGEYVGATIARTEGLVSFACGAEPSCWSSGVQRLRLISRGGRP